MIKTSVDRTLTHLLYLLFVIITSVIVHMALIEAVGLLPGAPCQVGMGKMIDFWLPISWKYFLVTIQLYSVMFVGESVCFFKEGEFAWPGFGSRSGGRQGWLL